MLNDYSAETLDLLYRLKHCSKEKRHLTKRQIYEIEVASIRKNILKSDNIKKEIRARDFKRIEVQILTKKKFATQSLVNPNSLRNRLTRFHIYRLYKLLVSSKPNYFILEKAIRLSNPVTIAFIKNELNAKSIEIFKTTKEVTR